MKILHIVAYVDKNFSYGGPARVALGLAEGYARIGHAVDVVACSRDSVEERNAMAGSTRLITFRGMFLAGRKRYSGLVSPALLFWVLRNQREYDIVHIHMGRDLLTLPAAILTRGRNLVVQTHGMLAVGRQQMTRAFSPLLRLALSNARSIVTLTLDEQALVFALGVERDRVVVLTNFVMTPAAGPRHLLPETQTEVIFLSRLHARKRPLLFVEVAARLHLQYPNTRFTLIGPDGGEAKSVLKRIAELHLEHVCSWEGAIPATHAMERMALASVYVHTAINEPFGLTIIEAMAQGVPVVVTRSAKLSDTIAKHSAGMVSTDDAADIAAAVGSLLENPDKRLKLSQAGSRLIEREYGFASHVERWNEVYEGLNQ